MRDQPWFANQVARIETTLRPVDLLHELQMLEQRMGRLRKVKWGPRTIDVDILVLGDYESDSEQLQLPHPRMLKRAFVLIPLAELDSNLLIQGRTVSQWLASVHFRVQGTRIWQVEV